jgi:hypothetical protein
MPLALIFRKPPQSAFRTTFQNLIRHLRDLPSKYGYHLTICSGYYTSHAHPFKNPKKEHWFAENIISDIEPIIDCLSQFTLIGCKSGSYGNYKWEEEFIANYNYIAENLSNTKVELCLPVDRNGNRIVADVHAKIILLSVQERQKNRSSTLCALVGSSNMTSAAFGSKSGNPSIETDVLIHNPRSSLKIFKEGGLKKIVSSARNSLEEERRDRLNSEEPRNSTHQKTETSKTNSSESSINAGQREIIYVSGMGIDIENILNDYAKEILNTFKPVENVFYTFENRDPRDPKYLEWTKTERKTYIKGKPCKLP